MRIAIPTSAHDAHLLPDTLKLLRHFGRLENHSISFAPAQSQMALCEKAANEISDLTQNIDILPIMFEGDGRWPQSPNLHWTLTMEALVLKGCREPIFWYEQDFNPGEERWADKLEDVWRRGRKPLAGKIVPTPHRNAAGAIVFEPDDLMMMGCGVYAHNLFTHPQQHVYTGGFRSGETKEPFDVFLRGWLRGLGWTPTDAIGDRWNTKDYRFEDGVLTCSPGETQFKNRDHSQTDITGAVGVHGCKDGSLARLILEHGSLSKLLGYGTPNPAKTGTGATVPVGIDLSELKQATTELREARQDMVDTTNLLKELITQFQAASAPPEPEVETDRIPDEANLNGHAFDLPAFRGVLNEAGVAVRLGELVQTTGVSKEGLLLLASQPDSRIRVRGQWASLMT